MPASQDVSTQRRLNFEMSAKNLFQSFADRDRVPKIQGLLNECMTFLDDELSVITGPYDNLLSINEVIDQQLILFVSLNINKNTAPVRALGKMLLQNLQMVVGKRYESESERKRRDKPLFSVVMDEFAPFGYRNFAQILNTARGTNTAFLFSMQSLPQLLQVGKGFQQDVSSAPGTTMLLQTRDEETAKYFKQASSQVTVQKRTQQLWRNDFLGFERFQKAVGATEREQLEFRALDHHIKNLGKGKMEILMTDAVRGTLHGRLHVRPPSDVRVPCFEPAMFPRLRSSRDDSQGAKRAFQGPEIGSYDFATAEMRREDDQETACRRSYGLRVGGCAADTGTVGSPESGAEKHGGTDAAPRAPCAKWFGPSGSRSETTIPSDAG